MKEEEEDISEEQIAASAAKDRIVGVAIQHYLHEHREGEPIHCSICAAVKNFEAKLAPGNLKMLADLYLQPEWD